VILFDTSVVIDARDVSSPWHDWARLQIAEAASEQGAAVNTIVIAEAAVRVEQRDRFASHLQNMGFVLLPLPITVGPVAAKAYSIYLDRLKAEGKGPLSRIPLGDFLIGAHAEVEGMTLVTRDPARVKTYFPSVTIRSPHP
jgi:predicted nucleic acid-binding protein